MSAPWSSLKSLGNWKSFISCQLLPSRDSRFWSRLDDFDGGVHNDDDEHDDKDDDNGDGIKGIKSGFGGWINCVALFW